MILVMNENDSTDNPFYHTSIKAKTMKLVIHRHREKHVVLVIMLPEEVSIASDVAVVPAVLLVVLVVEEEDCSSEPGVVAAGRYTSIRINCRS